MSLSATLKPLVAAVLMGVSACAPLGHSPSASPAPQSVADLARWQARFERRMFQTREGTRLPYRIASPAGSTRRPLVLVLHGSGAIGADNEAQLGRFAASWAQLLDFRDPPVIVVPQVPRRSADYALCGDSPCASRPGPSFGSLSDLLDSFAADDGIDPGRIYLVGFSMGASAALQLALARPGRIAGVVAFAPVPPPKDRAAELRRLPLLVVHGSADTENPFEVSRGWVRQLIAVGGGARLDVRQGMEHQVPDDMVTDAEWRRRLLDGTLLGSRR